MPLVARLAGLYKFPFSPAFAEPFLTLRVNMPMRIIYAQNIDFFSLPPPAPLFEPDGEVHAASANNVKAVPAILKNFALLMPQKLTH